MIHKTDKINNENSLNQVVSFLFFDSQKYATSSKSDIYLNNWHVVPGTKSGQRWLILTGTAADYQHITGVKTMNSNRLTPTN